MSSKKLSDFQLSIINSIQNYIISKLSIIRNDVYSASETSSSDFEDLLNFLVTSKTVYLSSTFPLVSLYLHSVISCISQVNGNSVFDITDRNHGGYFLKLIIDSLSSISSDNKFKFECIELPDSDFDFEYEPFQLITCPVCSGSGRIFQPFDNSFSDCFSCKTSGRVSKDSVFSRLLPIPSQPVTDSPDIETSLSPELLELYTNEVYSLCLS